ncbi:MAG: tRNA (adenine-N1)-methyltransferase [Candidatus Bathyarchaeia archaeon]
MNEIINEDTNVILYFDEKRKWFIKVKKNSFFHTHKGIIKLDELIGKSFGECVKSTLGHKFLVLKPTLYDYIMNCERPTQIIYPKDIGLILIKLGVSPGKKIIEVGTGSGALTIALANAIKPNGHVYSYEIREEFIKVAKKNLSNAGLLDFVTIRHANAKEGFLEKDVDALVMDVAEPWEIIPHAYKALKGGYPLASFSPTINQVEKTAISLKENRFIDVETIECFIREIKVKKGSTRPATTMIGHTGYITFAKKILQ